MRSGFSKIERDDRLLDVFPAETKSKGVELLERWTSDCVEIVRVHNGRKTHHPFARSDIERALLHNTTLNFPSRTNTTQ